MNRYNRNHEAISVSDMQTLQNKSICVIGCGGLGGYIVEIMSRIGVKKITVVDMDVFEETNLNRQLFSSESKIGKPKVFVAKERIKDVNSTTILNPIFEKFDESNAINILRGHDLIVDALDSIKTRFLLQDFCKQLNIKLVHGAIGGWYGQITTIFPGDDTFDILYKNIEQKGIESKLGNLPFSASLVASLQCSEITKVLLDKGELLRNKILRIDILRNEFYTIELM